MPSLNAMRGLEPGAASPESQPLGPPIRPEPPAPDTASKPTSTPGIWQGPDGKLETRLPDPPAWCAKPPEVSGYEQGYLQAVARDPIRYAEIGKVYALEEVQSRLVIPKPGMRFTRVELGAGLVIAQWARQPTQPAPARVAKVGDWVRILSGQPDCDPLNNLIGEVVQITAVRGHGIIAGGWSFHHPDKSSDDGCLMTEFASTPLHGKRADVAIVDGLQPAHCSTCQDSGQIYQEHQRGCHVGGDYNCPDCSDSEAKR